MSRGEGVGMSTERLERIGQGMRRFIDAGNIPGTVTLVARKGQVVHFEANGQRNVATGEPMTKDTIFRLFSQTKPITGAAVMMLFEEGKFFMTDPVFKGVVGGQVQTEPANTIHTPITDAHIGIDCRVHSRRRR